MQNKLEILITHQQNRMLYRIFSPITAERLDGTIQYRSVVWKQRRADMATLADFRTIILSFRSPETRSRAVPHLAFAGAVP